MPAPSRPVFGHAVWERGRAVLRGRPPLARSGGKRLVGGRLYFQVSVFDSVSFLGAVSIACATQEVVPSRQLPVVSATCTRC